MKHIFVINPSAGRVDSSADIIEKLHAYDGRIDYQTYVTTCAGDGTRFVRETCAANPDEQLRFYACGGDGTINEVVSGLIGFANAQLSCYPCGSGNDYIKYYGTQADYLDLDRLIDGVPHQVDVMRLGDRYSINVCNLGFDAEVVRTMIQVKRKPLIGGTHAYTTGIVKAIFTGRKNICTITVDGETFHDGKMLLCTLSNGQYVGGAYRCAPHSKNDDGLLEVCLVKPMSIPRFARMINVYRDGRHLDDPSCRDVVQYRQGREVVITSPDPIYLVVDGDIIRGNRFHIENISHAATFVSPRP